MKAYKDMTREELLELKAQLEKEYKEEEAKGLKLNMARGKPGLSQLEIAMPMLDVVNSNSDMHTLLGTDTRNYGDLDGIGECRRLMAQMIGVEKDNVIVGGNSSLNLMYDMIARSFCFGVRGCTPWCRQDKIKFLCPVPGYDRHFKITEQFDIEMINIPLSETGPDMDMVEKYVNNDPAVKGIWCVPKYSNPTGISYSDETVRRFANLKPAAEDFRIYWDNAYSVHHLYRDKEDFLLEILEQCDKAGNPDIVYKFTSTSKISFPGSGIAAIASSPNNCAEIKRWMGYSTIGYDKVNQLRHVRFFKNLDGIKAQMRRHAEVLRPKFEVVESILEEELSGLATWSKPNGGYFIALKTKGIASKVIARCKDCGLILTEAGCAYPYHKDPEDSLIRIAPSYPSLEELELASRILCLAVKIETLLNK